MGMTLDGSFNSQITTRHTLSLTRALTFQATIFSPFRRQGQHTDLRAPHANNTARPARPACTTYDNVRDRHLHNANHGESKEFPSFPPHSTLSLPVPFFGDGRLTSSSDNLER
eukprot:scpid99141/ scgid33649/ 